MNWLKQKMDSDKILDIVIVGIFTFVCGLFTVAFIYAIAKGFK